MKALLSILPILLFVGCGSPDLDDPKERAKILAEAFSQGIEIVPKVINDEHVWYLRDEETLFTGWIKRGLSYDGLTATRLTQYKEGRKNGTDLIWCSETGQKIFKIQFKDGKKNGLDTQWHENGIKLVERVYEDGNLISAKKWKPNGEKCPFTNINNGNGIEVFYDESGLVFLQSYFKNGESFYNTNQLIKEAKDNRASKLLLNMYRISDFAPLAGLTNLTELHLRNTNISDLTPLAGLTNLSELYLLDNNISDLTPLARLTNLTELNLRNNNISDITHLGGLMNLTELNLRDNNISDSQEAMLRKALGSIDILFKLPKPRAAPQFPDWLERRLIRSSPPAQSPPAHRPPARSR